MKRNKDNRQAKGLSSISQTLQPFTRQLLGQKGFVEIDILTNWNKIAGEELAQFSFPQKIDFKKGQKNNGTLHIQVPSGAFALEIQHREKFIIDKINSYFGYNAVSSLKIIQNNHLDISELKEPHSQSPKEYLVNKEEEKYINKLTNDIKNEKLKEILTKLGQSIFNNNHNEKKKT